MEHIFLNLKRFDVPTQLGGVNRLAPVAEWGRTIVEGTEAGLRQYDPAQVEFVMYLPEAHLLSAAAACGQRHQQHCHAQRQRDISHLLHNRFLPRSFELHVYMIPYS